MNMGPQHPSAHGVFRAILTLEGETVVAVDAVIGYLHRCHEKLAETLTYVQYPSIASKTDYVSAMTAELTYVSAVEKVGKIDVPRRAQYLRVLAAELQRVASHCLWLGTWCMDMGGALGGGATVFLYAIRERELILDLFEALTGARLLYGFHQVGGVRYDLPAGWTEQCRQTLNLIEQRLREYEAMLEDNPFFLVRTQGVGVISRELALDVGVCGPLIRGSGIDYDVRRAEPYSSYGEFTFKVPVETAGDCYARYRVRMVEFRESIAIARQALDGLPEGPISSRPGVKSVGQVRVPKGEGYARVEGARGELGCYLVADGGAKPYRLKWRGASFCNLAVLPHIIPGHKIADVVAIMGSVDPVFGESRQPAGERRPSIRPLRWLSVVPPILYHAIAAFVVLNVVIGLVTYVTLLERKFAARMQSRIGPYYVGWPHGWLQPIADALKLMMKEDIVPNQADRWVYNLAPLVFLVPCMLIFATIPFAPGLGVADLNIGVLFFLAVSSLEIVGLFMGGWGSHNKYALLSAMRAVNQIISYDLPFVFVALIPVVLAGSLQMSAIVAAQSGLFGWFVFYPVLGQLAFVAFLVATLAAENRVPFDILEAESELVAGFRVEYSGMKFALIQLAEYAHMIGTSFLGALLFLGGWLGPGPEWLGPLWFLLKAMFVFLVVTWVRWSFVRIRVDQILAISWKLLLPISLVLLLATAFVVAYRSAGVA